MPYKIAPFIKKTYELVSDTTTNSIVSWSYDGYSFTVHQPYQFQQDILPTFFNHSNICSFIRQLNIYGFHKLPSSSIDSNVMEFKHPQFIRNKEELLKNISRKKILAKRSRKQAKLTSSSVDFSLSDIQKLTGSTSYDNLNEILNDNKTLANVLSIAIKKQKEDENIKSQLENDLSKAQEEIAKLKNNTDNIEQYPPTKKQKLSLAEEQWFVDGLSTKTEPSFFDNQLSLPEPNLMNSNNGIPNEFDFSSFLELSFA